MHVYFFLHLVIFVCYCRACSWPGNFVIIRMSFWCLNIKVLGWKIGGIFHIPVACSHVCIAPEFMHKFLLQQAKLEALSLLQQHGQILSPSLDCWGFVSFKLIDLFAVCLRCRESVWELWNRGQHFCLVCGCRKEIFAAVSFLSFVVDQNQICHLNPANKISCFNLGQ